MPRQLLFIEDASHWLGEQCCWAASNIHAESISWTSLNPGRLCERNIDLIVAQTDPECAGAADFLRWLGEHPIGKPVLAIVTADGELMRTAARVADDFIVAPVRSEELRHRIVRILGEATDEQPDVSERLNREVAIAGLVGRHPGFLRIVERIPVLARSDTPVVITGETGTGKELCARAIHHLGPRRTFPFIPVDCAAFPDHLFENEMFGHARGAFTDAHRDQKGLIALAERGTLFLDEVDSLSLAAQSKLLRFLQDHTYRPLGSDRFVHADVNVIAATNRDLEVLVRERKFRADLFFRLNVLRVCLMPLRERRGDIALLARHFVEIANANPGAACKRVTPAALRKLTNYEWPGNIRELHNVVQGAIVLSDGAQILPSHVLLPSDAQTDAARGSFREARAEAIAAFERRYIEEILAEVGGNVTRAARIAQKDRRAFGRLIKRHNITRGACETL
jgi:two-component system response regulator GlrR